MSEIETWETEEKILDNQPQTRAQKLEEMVECLIQTMDKIHEGNFNQLKAEKMAALALSSQMRLAEFLADAELLAKQAKQEFKYISSEISIKYRTEAEKKLSEAALEALVNKDKSVCAVEKRMFDIEKNFKKWQYIQSTLEQAHFFLKGLGK